MREYSLSEIAARWHCSLANVSRHHVGPGKLQPTRRGRSQMVRVTDLAVYERKRARRLEARAACIQAKARAFRVGAQQLHAAATRQGCCAPGA